MKRFSFRKKVDANFGLTVLAKFSDLGLKFGVLLVFMLFRSGEDLVNYTYFLSLGAILGAIFDWGASRQNIRIFSEKKKLPINIISPLIAIIAFIIILYGDFIKYENESFLGLCILYALTNSIILTFIKYYEFIGNNKELYRFQVILNLICSVLIVSGVALQVDLVFIYLLLILANSILIFRCIVLNRRTVIFQFKVNLLKNGLPFLVNSLAVMAFSQLNIVLVNQIASPNEIVNFVLAQRILEVSLMLPNSFTSSSIGKFLKGDISFFSIQNRVIRLWFYSMLVCMIMAFSIFIFFKDYKLIIYLFLLLLPLGLTRSVSAGYSIALDYTKYYLVRTIAILIILALNISLASTILKLPGGIYYFCGFISVLIILLQITYYLTFRKYNIYEAFYSKL